MERMERMQKNELLNCNGGALKLLANLYISIVKIFKASFFIKLGA